LKLKTTKKQFYSEGDYCNNLAFGSKGVLKSYTLDERGKNMGYWLEGWWVSDFKTLSVRKSNSFY
jgi:hypothetical protein